MAATLKTTVVIVACWWASLVFADTQITADEAPRSMAGVDVRVGVLAKRGVDRAVTRWQPLADYLNRSVRGYRFEIVPLSFSELYDAVKQSDIDLVLANSGIFVDLEHMYGLRPLATMKNRRGDAGLSLFGGLIIAPVNRKDITYIEDLRGKNLAAVSEQSLGGWLMARREFAQLGMGSQSDFASVQFLGTHDAVVNAVLSGDVDGGTVRTDTLERMVEEGALDKANIRVLRSHTRQGGADQIEAHFPYPLSTALYPEWPLAKLSHASDAMGLRVAVALLSMPADSPEARAMQVKGWDIARSYAPVGALYRELQLGSYEGGQRTDPFFVADETGHYVAMTALTLMALLAIVLAAHYRAVAKNAVHEISYLTMHDPLTRLPSRRMFRIFAESTFAQARREGWQVYLFSIDLDGFAKINDEYGHEVGDELLRQVSKRLRVVMPLQDRSESAVEPSTDDNGLHSGGVLRGEDHIARVAADNFLCLLVHVREISDVRGIAQRLIAKLGQSYSVDGKTLEVTASIGVGVFPFEADNLHDLIAAANVALAEAKQVSPGTYRMNTSYSGYTVPNHGLSS